MATTNISALWGVTEAVVVVGINVLQGAARVITTIDINAFQGDIGTPILIKLSNYET